MAGWNQAGTLTGHDFSRSSNKRSRCPSRSAETLQHVLEYSPEKAQGQEMSHMWVEH